MCRHLLYVTAVPSWSCSKAVYKPVWHIPLLSVQWINSWWWTDELSETCRVSCQNKFVKLVHLFGFIIKKYWLFLVFNFQPSVIRIAWCACNQILFLCEHMYLFIYICRCLKCAHTEEGIVCQLDVSSTQIKHFKHTGNKYQGHAEKLWYQSK
jgi:hypothetical protein